MKYIETSEHDLAVIRKRLEPVTYETNSMDVLLKLDINYDVLRELDNIYHTDCMTKNNVDGVFDALVFELTDSSGNICGYKVCYHENRRIVSVVNYALEHSTDMRYCAGTISTRLVLCVSTLTAISSLDFAFSPAWAYDDYYDLLHTHVPHGIKEVVVICDSPEGFDSCCALRSSLTELGISVNIASFTEPLNRFIRSNVNNINLSDYFI